MKRIRGAALFIAALLAAYSMSGCTNVGNGIYSDGSRLPDTSAAPQESTTLPTATTIAPVTTAPEATQPPETTITVTELSDVIEPIVTGGPWDYASLSTERNGYGQGTHFDELNRPSGAIRFNEGYSKYNAKAINETEEKVIMLTFDQGYENGYTGMILDTLKEKA